MSMCGELNRIAADATAGVKNEKWRLEAAAFLGVVLGETFRGHGIPSLLIQSDPFVESGEETVAL